MLNDFSQIVSKAKDLGFVYLITHDELFHMDDLCCTALLEKFFEKFKIETKIIRTRNYTLVPEEDNVIIYDVFNTPLDHHSKNKVYDEKSGRILSSIGKLWRFGKEEFCKGFEIDKRVWEKLDKEIFGPIDLTDNYSIMNPLTYWMNCKRNVTKYEDSWDECLKWAKSLISDIIEDAKILMKESVVLANCPIMILKDRKFRISERFCRGYSEDHEVVGLIWRTERRTLAVKSFGNKKPFLNYNKFIEMGGPSKDVIYIHPNGIQGEFKDIITLTTYMIDKTP